MSAHGHSVEVWVRVSFLDEITLSIKKKSSGKSSSLSSTDDSASKNTYDWAYGIYTITGDGSLTVQDEEFPDYNGKSYPVPKSSLQCNEHILLANVGTHTTVNIPDSETESVDSNNEGAQQQQQQQQQHKVTTSTPMIPHDLIQLTHLHTPAVVHCLRKRYEQGLFYTATGDILLALNPLRPCPHLYEDKCMDQYWHLDSTISLPPHVFGIANNAFGSMMRGIDQKGNPTSSIHGSNNDDTDGDENNTGNNINAIDQTILVSGESGSGKTVSTKYIMNYLANLSMKKTLLHSMGGEYEENNEDEIDNDNKSQSSLDLQNMQSLTSWQMGANVEKKVLQSNPILESFGNARTLRNDNSSRFGKFIELQFKHTGSLIGAFIDTYLMEKVRLIHQGAGERNFHIFYQILAGVQHLSATECEEGNGHRVESHTMRTVNREDLYLRRRTEENGDGETCATGRTVNLTPHDFKLTSMSGTFDRRDGVQDDASFRELCHAMETIGLDAADQRSIFGVVCAIMHATNLTVLQTSPATSEDDSDDRACALDGDNPSMSAVLSLMGLELKMLTTAICNVSITPAGEETFFVPLSKDKAEKKMEAFVKATYGALFQYVVQEINTLMSTCDGVSVTARHPVTSKIGLLDIYGFESFQKNSFEQLCINYCNESLQQQFNWFVFESEQQEYKREGIDWSFINFPDNKGVLDILDSVKLGILPLLDDVCKTSGNTDRVFASQVYFRYRDKHANFSANRRQFAYNLFELKHYAGPVEYDMTGFIEKNTDQNPKESIDLLLSSSNEFVVMLADKMSPVAVPLSSKNSPTRSSRNKKTITVGEQFMSQLRQLRARIDRTHSHYIRCLKPNENLMPHEFNQSIIADQLRCAGVLEVVRISRLGFPQRYTCAEFLRRYRIIVFKTLDQISSCDVGDLHGQCASLIKAVSAQLLEHSQKNNAHSYEDDMNPEMSVQNFGTGMQIGNSKVFLRFRTFRHLESFRRTKIDEAITSVQRTVRRYLARRRLHAALSVQSFYRMICAQRMVAKIRTALHCQRIHRGTMGRRLFASTKLRKQSAIRIQTSWRKHGQYERFTLLKISALTLQCMARTVKARKRRQKLVDAVKVARYAKVYSERDTLQHENVSLKERLEKATQDTERLTADNSRMREELAITRANMKERESQDSAILDVRNNLESENTVLKQRVDILSNELQQTCTEFTTFKSSNAKIVKDLEEAVENKILGSNKFWRCV